VPPLRERREDLPALCEALLARIAHESGMPVPRAVARGSWAIAAAPAAGQRARAGEPAAPRRGAERRRCRLAPGSRASIGRRRQPSRRARCPPRSPAAPPTRGAAAGSLPPTCRPGWTSRSATSWCARCRPTGFNRTAAAARLGLSLRQIRYRIARLGITAPQRRCPCRRRPDPAPSRCGRAAGGAARRALPSPNFGPRPAGASIDLIVVHSISLPPGQFGGGCAGAVHQPLDWDAHPYFQQHSRAGGVGAFLHPARRRGCGSLSAATTAPGTRCRSYRGRATATTIRSASSSKGWKATCSAVRRWRACARHLAALPHRAHRRPRAHGPGAGFAGHRSTCWAGMELSRLRHPSWP
jgi:hypothetical protein